MANPTTNYSFAMPTNTDLVKDLPADFEIFGQAVDTKIKDLSPETTAGDLAYRGSTANARTRLAIGTAGQVLTVNSGATAPEWTTPASGGMTLINTGGTTLSGASVSISSIPSTYKDLQLIVRNPKPATDNTQIIVRINNDSGTRYAFSFNGASNNNTFGDTGAPLSRQNDNSVAEGFGLTYFYDYTNTTTWKTGYNYSFTNNATTTANFNQLCGTWIFNQTGAITELTILAETGNLTSGTAYLYGVK